MSSAQPDTVSAPGGTYIYCIARNQNASSGGTKGQALAVSGTGIGGKPVRAVSYSDVAAVVSDSPFDSYDVTRENLTAHEQIVEHVMEQSDVLPVSFGTVAEDDQAVQQQLLAPALDDLHQALELVHGRVELGVKALWEKERLFAELEAEDESIRTLLSQIAGTTPEETYDERTQLGELISAGIEQKREQDAAEILGVLQPLAVDSRVNDVIGDLMVLNASFLVEKQKISAFESQLDALRKAQEGRMRFQSTGSLPPYNFVSIMIGEGDQSAEVTS